MPQSLAKIYLHLVFATKGHRPIIDPSHRDELAAYAVGTMKGLNCPSIRIRAVADHLHCLFLLGRTTEVADVVEALKGSTSRWLKTKGPDYAQFHWQVGYGVFSVSASLVEATCAYIDNQEAHHRQCTFKDEFLTFLKKYDMEYDERYVWD